MLGLPENRFARGAAVARARDDSADAREAKVDAVLRLRFELEMNPSADAVARGKRQRIEFEIGIAEAPVTNRRANRVCEEDHANRAEAEKQKGARITAAHHLRCKPSDDREQDHVAENADHPIGDFGPLVQALRAAAGPVRAPQPRREWIRFFDPGLFLQASIAADRCVDEAAATEGKNRAEHDAENPVPIYKISVACELRIDEEKPGTQKGESEKGQESGSGLGGLCHTLILESHR